jgi:hypothetical protein
MADVTNAELKAPEARGARQPTGHAAWVGCTAPTNTTASLSPMEFKVSSQLAMNAFYVSSSSLRAMTSGL